MILTLREFNRILFHGNISKLESLVNLPLFLTLSHVGGQNYLLDHFKYLFSMGLRRFGRAERIVFLAGPHKVVDELFLSFFNAQSQIRLNLLGLNRFRFL